MKRIFLLFVLLVTVIFSTNTYGVSMQDFYNRLDVLYETNPVIFQTIDNKIDILLKQERTVNEKNFLLNIRTYIRDKMEESTFSRGKDLGNGFILNQEGRDATLLHNKSKVYSWSYDLEKVPFVGDGGCPVFIADFIKSGSDWDGVWDQEIWDKLTKAQQKGCLYENYNLTISVSKIDETFATINKGYYEWTEKMLFHVPTTTLLQNETGASLYEIVKIKYGKSGAFMLFQGGRGNDGGILFIASDTNEQKILFRNTDLGASNPNYKEITDFELMVNKQIKVKYFGENKSQREVVLDI